MTPAGAVAAPSSTAVLSPDRTERIARVAAEFDRGSRARLRASLLWGALLLVLLYVCGSIAELSPQKLWEGLPRIGEYFSRMTPNLAWQHLFAGPKVEGSLAFWFYRLPTWAWLLFETANMAAMATIGGSAIAFLLAFPASRNLAPSPLIFAVTRRFLEVCRTVPEIVYALIFVWAFGIGPLAGILAIGIHTAGANGKLFSEVIENADLRPLDGVRASGGNWFHGVRYAVVPQVLPNIASYVLLRFEINVRAASVIGFVGAGGIGQELYHVISFNYYEEISAIVLLIILCVAAIDLLSEYVRTSFIGEARA